MKTTTFWDIAPCSLAEADRRFKGAYCRRLQGDDLPIPQGNVILTYNRNLIGELGTQSNEHNVWLASFPFRLEHIPYTHLKFTSSILAIFFDISLDITENRSVPGLCFCQHF
jgi:hypothetical protein